MEIIKEFIKNDVKYVFEKTFTHTFGEQMHVYNRYYTINNNKLDNVIFSNEELEEVLKTMQDNKIGLIFTDGIRQYKVLEVVNIKDIKYYRVKNFTENKETELFALEQIEKYVTNAEHYNIKYNRGIERQREVEEEQKKLKEQEEERIKDYNFCYGYTDNKTDLQKGKILKTLNQNILYNNNFYTRKNLIHKLINNNSRIEIYNNTNRYRKKNMELERKKLKDKIEYRFYYDGNTFITVTKTEYEYIRYLLSIQG